MVNGRWFKYSDYFHRNAIMYWPMHIREQWGILIGRLRDESVEDLHPIDAEVQAFEIIRAKIVKMKRDDPSLDLKALGFGDPCIVESEDVGRFPDWDHMPMDSNGFTQSWYDENGQFEGYYLSVNDAYRQALADEAERFARAPTGEKKSKPPKPVEGPSLALTPDMESRLIRVEEPADECSHDPLPMRMVDEPSSGPDNLGQDSVVIPPVKVIHIDPNVCKQSKIPAPAKKPPRRGKGKHDKAAGTFSFGD